MRKDPGVSEINQETVLDVMDLEELQEVDAMDPEEPMEVGRMAAGKRPLVEEKLHEDFEFSATNQSGIIVKRRMREDPGVSEIKQLETIVDVRESEEPMEVDHVRELEELKKLKEVARMAAGKGQVEAKLLEDLDHHFNVCFKDTKVKSFHKRWVSRGGLSGFYKVPEDMRRRAGSEEAAGMLYDPRHINFSKIWEFFDGDGPAGADVQTLNQVRHFCFHLHSYARRLGKRDVKSLMWELYEEWNYFTKTHMQEAVVNKNIRFPYDPEEAVFKNNNIRFSYRIEDKWLGLPLLLSTIFLRDLWEVRYFEDPECAGLLDSELWADLLLLENQIPLLIPIQNKERLYGTIDSYFAKYIPLNSKAKHRSNEFCFYHVLHFIHNALLPTRDDLDKDPIIWQAQKWRPVPTATKLQQAGIKFDEAFGEGFLVDFKGGVLTLPNLYISKNTKKVLMNLIAWERCHLLAGKYIIYFVIFMHYLINNSKDAEVLKQSGVLDYILPHEEVAGIFNSVGQDLIVYIDPLNSLDSDFDYNLFSNLSVKLYDSYQSRKEWKHEPLMGEDKRKQLEQFNGLRKEFLEFVTKEGFSDKDYVDNEFTEELANYTLTILSRVFDDDNRYLSDRRVSCGGNSGFFKVPEDLRRRAGSVEAAGWLYDPEHVKFSKLWELFEEDGLHADFQTLSEVRHFYIHLHSYAHWNGNTDIHSLRKEMYEEYDNFTKTRLHIDNEFKHKGWGAPLLLGSTFLRDLFQRSFENELDPINDPECAHLWVFDLWADLLLLENQIPLLIPIRQDKERFYSSIFGYFADFLSLNANEISEAKVRSDEFCFYHVLHFIHRMLLPTRNEQPSKQQSKRKPVPTATRLQQAGIEFKPVDKAGFVVEFKKGVLKLPRLHITKNTKKVLMNLIAWETCNRNVGQYIIFFVIFMDSLINTAKDVEVLNQCGVLEHILPNEEVAGLFNSFGEDLVYTKNRQDYDFFSELSVKLNDYCQSRPNRWWANLMQDYFKSPWTIISVVAALVVILFTAIQTFFSAYSYFRPPQ